DRMHSRVPSSRLELRRCRDELSVVLRRSSAFQRERVLEADAYPMTVRDRPAQHRPRRALVAVHDERQRERAEDVDDRARGLERRVGALLARLDERTHAESREIALHEATGVVDRPDTRLDTDIALDERRHERRRAVL